MRRRVFLEGEELEAFWEKEKLAKQQAEKYVATYTCTRETCMLVVLGKVYLEVD